MITNLWRKLTTRPVWWLERRRQYFIRHKILGFAPIGAGCGPAVLAVLTTPSTFLEALWVAWSWLRFLAPCVGLNLYVDGAVTAFQEQTVSRLFPGSVIYQVSTFLRKHAPERLCSNLFVQTYPLGKKLALVLAAQANFDVLYCDDDVLAFNQPAELEAAITKKDRVCLFNQQPGYGSFDPWVLGRASELGVSHAPDLNAGLMWIPRGSLSLALAHQLLEGWHTGVAHPWFTEQTVCAVLMKVAGGEALPADRYDVSMARQFYWQPDVDYSVIAARHFVFPVRHVMYIKGLPCLLAQATGQSPLSVPVIE